jgi:cell wall-associated NlpC family hydrolase
MAKITQADMQAADIIVSTGSGLVSTVIRTGSASRFSHAALYIGKGDVIEAINKGVVQQKLELALNNDTLAVVYRRKNLSATQARLVIRYASRQVGKSYDYAGVVGASKHTVGGMAMHVIYIPLGVIQDIGEAINMISPESSFFCSELVLRAFEHADARITFKPATISAPGDIPGSHQMQYIGHLKKSVKSAPAA